MPRDELSFKLDGLQPLLRRLDKLPRKVQQRAYRTGLRKAAAAIIKPARANIKAAGAVETGLLAKSLSFKLKKYPRTQTAVVVIGPRTDLTAGQKKARAGYQGARAKRSPAHYAHLVENPIKPHEIPTKLIGDAIIVDAWVHPGSRGCQFLKKAFDANKARAYQALTREIGKALWR